MNPPPTGTQSLFWAPLLAIGAAAFAVEIPFFFFGTPSGHDVEFHLYSWLEVLAQWKHGIIYPRWAALAHFAYGEPRFVFYPPASWTLGGAISAFFPWTIASPIYIWIVLVLAGVSMFALARRWLDRRTAIFAAVLYAVNPYHLVIVYWRSAFAELLASCLVPLLLLCVLRAVDGKRHAVVALGAVLAAAWLTNAPAAVMIHYSLALLMVFFAWKNRSPKLLLRTAGAVALGACLAAFYLLPAIYEQRWIEIANAVSAGSRPSDNFLFAHTTDADHDAFNRMISWLALLEMGVIFAAAFATRFWRQSGNSFWNALFGWAAACSVMMFSATSFLWNILPKLRFMQFPWRWLLCLSMIFTLCVTVGLRRWWQRAAVCVLSLVVLVLAWRYVQAPWWDTAADLREMQDNVATGAGYEGTDEYMPLGADPSVIDKDARKVTVDGPSHAAIDVLRWDAELKIFTAQMSAADQLALRLFRYPAWQVRVNGRDVGTAMREGTGQMLVPVEAGMNRVEMRFVRTWDRVAGGWISVATILVLLSWYLRFRREPVKSP
ncbi:MAG TPA: 6-pyruvoyl-tetrahydropterin synthase-related protein [Candidatus Dormibacteraeota bacterium]|nr:6-pyruvoyl-tetrahydropterin synthase-related protein [Candidatus Dormibacteraeota bacterium]